MKHKIPGFVLFLLVLPALMLAGQEGWTAEKILLCNEPYSTVLSPDGQWVAYTITSSIVMARPGRLTANGLPSVLIAVVHPISG